MHCPFCGAIGEYGRSVLLELCDVDVSYLPVNEHGRIEYCQWCLFPTAFDETTYNAVMENPNGEWVKSGD